MLTASSPSVIIQTITAARSRRKSDSNKSVLPIATFPETLHRARYYKAQKSLHRRRLTRLTHVNEPEVETKQKPLPTGP